MTEKAAPAGPWHPRSHKTVDEFEARPPQRQCGAADRRSHACLRRCLAGPGNRDPPHLLIASPPAGTRTAPTRTDAPRTDPPPQPIDRRDTVENNFEHRVESLSPDGKRLYVACAELPDPHVGLDALGEALDWDRERLDRHVQELVKVRLLGELNQDEGIVTQPGLARTDARRRAEKHYGFVGEDTRQGQLRGYVLAYCRTVAAASALVHPFRPPLDGRGPQEPASAAIGEAMTWWKRDQRVVYGVAGIAACYCWHEDLWRLAENTWGLYLQTRDHRPFLDLCLAGLDAAEQCGSRVAAARMHQQAAYVYDKLGERELATQHDLAAYDIGVQENHAATLATAESRRGRAARASGDWQAACQHYETSARLHREMKPPSERGYWMNRRRCGEMLILRKRDDEAVEALSAAADYMSDIDDIPQLTHTLIPLAGIHADHGDFDAARTLLTGVLDRAEDRPAPRNAQQIRSALDDLDHLRAARQTGQDTAEHDEEHR